MKKFLIAIFILLVLMVGGALALPGLIPSSVYKDKIQTQLTQELGRDVIISGDVKLRVFPSLGAQTGRVDVANPDDFEDGTFVSMDAMTAKVRLLPLLSKRVEISAFILDRPEINLIKKKNGHANWVIGTPSETAAPKTNDTPFKRDGRFSNIDPKIGLFKIKDGTVTYSDAQTDQSFSAEEVNMAFSMPSLSKPVEIDGKLTFNGEAAEIKLMLDTPRDFLDGKAAPVTFALITDFADIKTDGRFLEGETIAADVNIDANISDTAALIQLAPIDVPYGDLAQTIKISGNYIYDGVIVRARGASIAAKGASFEARFDGDATLAENPVLDGRVDANISNVPALLAALEQDVKGAELIQTASLSADFAADGPGFTAKNINAKANGNDLRATYTGSGAFAEALSLSGNFDVQADNPPAIIKALELEIPEAAVLGATQASGKVSVNGQNTNITDLVASTKSDTVKGDYQGNIAIGKTIALDGNFNAQISKLAEISQRIGKDIPYAASIGTIAANGRLITTGETLSIDGLSASLTDGQMNGRFDGGASTSLNPQSTGALALIGKLTADVPSIRAIAQTQNIALPPNSDAGRIYDAFHIEGDVSGNPTELNFANAQIALDAIKGTGDFKADMSGIKPYVTGTLLLDGLDLKPYMAAYAAQKESGAIEPWSEEPINMAAIRAVDGSFNIQTPFVKTGRMDLGDTKIAAELQNGKLTANMPELSTYGGIGSLNAALDASQAVPSIALDASLNALNSESFLGAVAGFTQASGEGGTMVSLRGSGISQAAIMKSLSGQGDFKILNGQVSGVDVSQFLTGVEEALTSHSLPAGIGPSHITKFKDLAGLFSIENGIAKIDTFTLKGYGVAASGGGQIDLGGQNIDFSLQPKLIGEDAKGLAAFGIPIRFSGNFGNAKAGLDTKLLGKIVEQRARARASQEVTSLLTDKIGGNSGGAIGGIVGNIIGGDQSNGQPSSTEDVVGGLLGSIVGGANTAQPQADQSKETTQPQEPSIEDAIIGGLFGKKKKKKKEGAE
ncbi:MAG: AsmA family protein [Maricaulaceae bacterium]